MSLSLLIHGFQCLSCQKVKLMASNPNTSQRNEVWTKVILYYVSEGKYIPLNVTALRMGYPVYFIPQATFLYKRCRACTTNHRQQRTKVRAKGIDAIWNQGYSSLLQYLFLICHFRHLFSLLQIRNQLSFSLLFSLKS